QPMIFPPDHAIFPNAPKRMRAVLTEHGLWRASLRAKCNTGKCDFEGDSLQCCAKCVLEKQADFLEQWCLVQEIIEDAGHLVIFLPKYHCELNFIE
ncbi:hypothetical protein OF83DRAFT_1020440, partial [Amylostereum chailletii]